MPSTGKSPFNLEPDSSLSLPACTFRTVLLLAQRLRYLMDEQLREDGLTTQQAALITAVIGLGGPSMSEAAASLGTTHQNVGQLVTVLQRKGLLRVESDPADRRRRRLVATPRNEEFWRGRDGRDFAAVARWFSVLSDEELGQLCQLLTRVAGALEQPAAEPAPDQAPGHPRGVA